MSPLVHTLLLISLFTTTLITMMSHHWLLAWLSLELNMLSIIPLMMKPLHPRATEAAIKYFLIQTFASTLIVFSSILNAWQTGQWTITLTPTPLATTLLTIAIMVKLGVAPTHLWYIEVLQGVTMNMALLITTWQKLAPLTLLYLTVNQLPMNIIITLGAVSTVLGGFIGLNQTQMRKIMACSSISHMGWLIITLNANPQLMTLTLLLYIILTTTTFNILSTTKTTSLLDLGTAWATSPTRMVLMMATLMSLGGIPPLTGFLPKLLILKNLISLNLIPLATMMALASLPSLFFYLRMFYLTTITSPPNTTTTEYKWRFKTPQLPSAATLSITSVLILPIAPLLYNTT
uniref:NADH-ubiquinone oxidoreductase chain 2 n=1 Tax=Uroplatus fimbriatus TaxID=402375 RepID=A0A0A1H9P2_9SAUR|nr:NADH dehydrogenase subunit 2 [Uroplatus fimbriatus]BAP90244.1 NADH dehydrogenase subunit 2 [Uroplatus fimbriatus]